MTVPAPLLVTGGASPMARDSLVMAQSGCDARVKMLQKRGTKSQKNWEEKLGLTWTLGSCHMSQSRRQATHGPSRLHLVYIQYIYIYSENLD